MKGIFRKISTYNVPIALKTLQGVICRVPTKVPSPRGNYPAYQSQLNGDPDSLKHPPSIRLPPEDTPVKLISQTQLHLILFKKWKKGE